MRILCVAEKPSQAKAVTQILSNGNFNSRNGLSQFNRNFDFQYRIAGNFVSVTMTSVSGHLTEVDFPEATRKWHSCDPVSLFTTPVVRKVGEKAQEIAKSIEREARVATHLYIWTDCDREGEGIGGEIVSVCRAVNPRLIVKRAHFSSVLPQEIHTAMQNPRELDQCQVAAVEARAELDLRIGAALTRFQTLRLTSSFASLKDKLISYGSCQFPTLGFVVDQFLRTERFVPETFWFLYLEHRKDDEKASFSWKRGKVFDQEACFALYAKCMGSPVAARVTSVQSRPKDKWRPLPLTTVDLQKCCSRYLRLAPDQIMSIAEGLYNQGFISYPRTETDQFDTNMGLKDIVTKLIQYRPFSTYANSLVNEGGFKWPRKGNNNDKAHPPIHPVAPANNLSGDSLRVYEFVTRRFLACCSDNAKGQATEVEVAITDERFSASGLMVLKRNYLDIYPFDRWAESTVPVYHRGDSFEPTVFEMRSGTTTAPKLLTDSDLIDIMDKNGIGTDATHATHIKTIIDREYIFRSSDKFLTPSTLGVGLIEGYDAMGLELSLSKPHLRCEMERELKRICEGAKTKDAVVLESVNLYKAVYTKSVEDVAKLENSLSRSLQQEPASESAIWTPSSARSSGVGGGEVCKCMSCRDGVLTLRSKASGGWIIGCNLYPQCRCAIWIPDTVAAISVGAETCPSCQSNSRGSAKMVDVRFKPGSAPPGTAVPYKSCIRGCDEFVNEMLDIRPPTQQHSAYPPASAAAAANGESNSWNARNIPATYRDQPRSQSANSNGTAAGTLSDAPLCSCHVPASRFVTAKEGPNKGRPFYKCSKGAPAACGYFEWQDQVSMSGGSVSSRQQQTNPPPAYASSTTRGYRRNEEPEVRLKCKCGLFAALRAASKAGPNQGREYFACTREFQGCGFLCWKDEVHEYMSKPSGSAPVSAAATSTCFNCGQAGHWSHDCPNPRASGRFSSYAPQPERPAAGGPARHARSHVKARTTTTRAPRGRGRGRSGRGGKSSARGSGAAADLDEPDWDSDFVS